MNLNFPLPTNLTKSVQKTKVIVGMSGGVDSSIAAYILQQQGFQVEGLFMKNWEGDDKDGCCAAEVDFKDAKAVCDSLNIPLKGQNFSKDYWDRVFKLFLQEYQDGRTPNPDILCNKEVKFKAFLNYAMDDGADFIATGHYARIFQNTNKTYSLLKGLDVNKDQSYFLYTLSQYQLSKSIFPVGHLEKPKVRELAKNLSLKVADKKDSTGICFIGERKFKEFLQNYLPHKPGDIIDTAGNIIGQHDGLMYYTLGQRKGLGIGGGHGEGNNAWYVADKILKGNKLIAVQSLEHKLLNHCFLVACNCDWVSGKTPKLNQRLTAKTRYRQIDNYCKIIQEKDSKIIVQFDQPQTAITPGQSVVFYSDDICLGGAVIQQKYHTKQQVINKI